MSNNFFDAEFESGTRSKLDLYRAYLRSWIPTFVSRANHGFDEIHIYDLFSGPGTDAEGNPGSPLIAIECIKDYEKHILEHNYTVVLHFSDNNSSSISKLKENISRLEIPPYIRLRIIKEKFPESFHNIDKTKIRNTPVLFFLDQFGVKEITPDILNIIASLKRADTLIFIASDFIKRFHSTDEIKNSFKFRLDDISDTPKNKIHRKICEIFNEAIDEKLDFHLSPFSIKKNNNNIYGIIHGSGHPIGIEKFLRECWKLDKLTGEANFDIDDEEKFQVNIPLFEEFNIPTKVKSFENELESYIRQRHVISDKEIFLFSIRRGFLPTKHAKPVLSELTKEGLIQPEDRFRYSKDCLTSPRFAKIKQP
jgi:three-Cys-motif partner protein